MSTSTFRQLVAEIAAKTKAALPTQVNGRIESAVKLVLGHDVTVLADGSIEVGSSTDPLKTYRLEGQRCDCQDFARGQAPEGWCQHRIAAAIQKRVQARLPVVPEMVEPGRTTTRGRAAAVPGGAGACPPTWAPCPGTSAPGLARGASQCELPSHDCGPTGAIDTQRQR